MLLITALIKVQSVNFERLAQGFVNEVKLSSNLRRIQHFFAESDLSSDLIAHLLFKLLPFSGLYRLTLGRTNWQYGQTNINILVLGVIYKGLSLPILWTFLGDKRGNSDQFERIALLNRFIRLFGVKSIAFLTADLSKLSLRLFCHVLIGILNSLSCASNFPPYSQYVKISFIK